MSTGLTSDNNPTNKDIREKIYDGLEYLHARADFWRQQKPMYARKRDKAKQRQSAKARNQDPTSYLLRCLEDIDDGPLYLLLNLAHVLSFIIYKVKPVFSDTCVIHFTELHVHDIDLKRDFL